MAWIKSIQLENRTVASYWELIDVYYSHKSQVSTFQYGGWVDAQAYEEGAPPLLTERHTIPAGLAPQLAAGALAFGTSIIRALPQFAGSTEP